VLNEKVNPAFAESSVCDRIAFLQAQLRKEAHGLDVTAHYAQVSTRVMMKEYNGAHPHAKQ
jgi:hypothetical protein